MVRKSIEERFWEKVDLKKKDDCWPWTASVNNHGYGRMRVNGKLVYAQRLSYIIHFGEIEKGSGYHGICVLHKCDNPLCVNPNHLFLGTHKNNMEDKTNKKRCNSAIGINHGSVTKPGRQPSGDCHWSRKFPDKVKHGADNGNSTLNNKSVIKMRKMYKSGSFTQKSLAIIFNTDQTNVSMIVNRKTWKHI